MKITITSIILLFSVGCGGSMGNSRWTVDYCSEHESDYHHSNHVCKSSSTVAHCVYAEDWLEQCRAVRAGLR